MIVNPGKSQTIIFEKSEVDHANQITNIDQKDIKAVSKVKLSGI